MTSSTGVLVESCKIVNLLALQGTNLRQVLTNFNQTNRKICLLACEKILNAADSEWKDLNWESDNNFPAYKLIKQSLKAQSKQTKSFSLFWVIMDKLLIFLGIRTSPERVVKKIFLAASCSKEKRREFQPVPLPKDKTEQINSSLSTLAPTDVSKKCQKKERENHTRNFFDRMKIIYQSDPQCKPIHSTLFFLCDMPTNECECLIQNLARDNDYILFDDLQVGSELKQTNVSFLKEYTTRLVVSGWRNQNAASLTEKTTKELTKKLLEGFRDENERNEEMQKLRGLKTCHEFKMSHLVYKTTQTTARFFVLINSQDWLNTKGDLAFDATQLPNDETIIFVTPKKTIRVIAQQQTAPQKNKNRNSSSQTYPSNSDNKPREALAIALTTDNQEVAVGVKIGTAVRESMSQTQLQEQDEKEAIIARISSLRATAQSIETAKKPEKKTQEQFKQQQKKEKVALLA